MKKDLLKPSEAELEVRLKKDIKWVWRKVLSIKIVFNKEKKLKLKE